MSENEKLLLFDASSMIYRSFFAVRSDNIRASLHLYKSWMHNMYEENEADYVASVVDLNNRKSKNFDLSDSYKAGRVTPPLLKEHYEDFMDVNRELGLKIIGVDGNEADDVIASVLNKFSDKHLNSLVVSSDKDLLQLVNDEKHIQVISQKNGGGVQYWMNKNVNEFYGIDEPSQVVLFKALVGDGSDGYPGVKGIGGKTASNFIKKYGNAKNIYEAVKTSEIKGAARRKMIEFKHDFVTSYRLALLNENLSIQEELSELKKF